MAEVHFTSHLRNLMPAGPFAASGATVGEALQALFAAEPQARLYVLDERGVLRKHVCIFADGERLPNDAALSRRIDDAQTAWFVPAIKDEVRMPRDGALCVSRTRDGGKTWQVLREGLPQRGAYDLIYRHGLDESDDRLAMGSTTGALWTSDTGGESWDLVNAHLPPIYALRFV